MARQQHAFASPGRLLSIPAVLGLGFLTGCLSATMGRNSAPLWLGFYAPAVLTFSLFALAAYAYDKRLSVVHSGRTFAQGARRVDEGTLHFLAFAGGWPGALIGQELFRHKTSKPAFRRLTWAIAALHLAFFFIATYFTWATK